MTPFLVQRDTVAVKETITARSVGLVKLKKKKKKKKTSNNSIETLIKFLLNKKYHTHYCVPKNFVPYF